MVNQVMACSKHITHGWSEYVPFVVCMEEAFEEISSNKTSIEDATKSCGKSTYVDADEVLKCYNGDMGATLQMDNAKLSIAHPGVPWVTLTNKSGSPMVLEVPPSPVPNNVLIRYICDAWVFNGGTKNAISACASDDSVTEVVTM
eukprot:gnl/TRDRNA2_/TRDRNA2_61800_c0_seq1.p1 gnl/TRDRNA2_/TRDRNA2_61800_c0~~gnl/TRDRNA2_/TRDRNA2_61800_c0_seq1.p1  ORF type:complete len:145 (-),score=19.41 gnl/TRDRNA2_/TRDRNA2_61800_c0_seq1:19-453(-)